MCRTQLDPLRLRPLDPPTIPPWLHPTKSDFLKKKKLKKQNKTKHVALGSLDQYFKKRVGLDH